MCLTPSGRCRYVSFGLKNKVFTSAQPQTTTLILGCNVVGWLDEHVCQLSATCVLVQGLGGASGCLRREKRDKDSHKSTSLGSGDANVKADKYEGARTQRRAVCTLIVPIE